MVHVIYAFNPATLLLQVEHLKHQQQQQRLSEWSSFQGVNSWNAVAPVPFWCRGNRKAKLSQRWFDVALEAFSFHLKTTTACIRELFPRLSYLYSASDVKSLWFPRKFIQTQPGESILFWQAPSRFYYQNNKQECQISGKYVSNKVNSRHIAYLLTGCVNITRLFLFTTEGKKENDQ